ncbi:MAG TPA: acyl-CoA dehydrogenase family protein [Pseudomonadales bacterium]|jgi:alkylation response protein AidB-like acyl-CoA dehydrogenase|nr:acyl-CoA dehydrogenase family protein [Pseudomonadales bacterium]MDP7450899.1 acyl-CoA dehydrogenase family protein [Arenicellales bacterium]HJP49734.1 acyl-CoA dehydrogenase family protein [Pseudomonadales bacterium]|tara:strand:- start:5752 stop:6915 length:1164 start_codon:yes stop_codon:yes gene_type:complete
MMTLDAETVRDWLKENFSEGIKNSAIGSDQRKEWTKRLATIGWTAPHWPKEYGGGGLSFQEHVVLLKEMQKVGASIPDGGMGMGLIGPTLLEYGTEEQKLRHLPRIVRREVRWCQGYSEPGAGSDLAGLSTRAVLDGDNYVINGQKIWTSGANHADWIFALVRTNPDAPKHDGISLVLIDMDQPGVTVKPIRLISGESPFCETFFDNAIATKNDLIGKPNHGWAIGKRLLQHERSGLSGMGAEGATASKKGSQEYHLARLAKKYVGESTDGKIADPAFRNEVIQQRLNQLSLELTLNRVREENASGKTLGEITSIFKLLGASQGKKNTSLQVQLMGSNGTGWEGDGFTQAELGATRSWLGSRAGSIAGGTNEVQLNIIAKRVLGLPD